MINRRKNQKIKNVGAQPNKQRTGIPIRKKFFTGRTIDNMTSFLLIDLSEMNVNKKNDKQMCDLFLLSF